MPDATWNCCRLGASSVYTIQPCTILQCHFIQSHKPRMHVCSAATCHLHFWQNDRHLLRATAIKRNGGADTEIIGSNSFVCGLPLDQPSRDDRESSKCWRFHVLKFNVHLRKGPWMYCPGHARGEGNDRADRLAGVLRHKWFESRKIWGVDELKTLPASTKPRTSYLRSPGGERHETRKHSTITVSVCKATLGKTSERQGGAHMDFLNA